MTVWALAMVLAANPRVHPGAPGIREAGPLAPASPGAVAGWMRARLSVRGDTTWTGRRIELSHGGWLLVMREHFRGHPIAGARIVLRVGPDGRVRQVVGTGLSRALSVQDATWHADAALWWPSERGLAPARIEETALSWVAGRPRQERVFVDARSGRVLARESLIDEVVVPIRGWPENPLITPELVDYDITLSDFDEIVLEDAVFRVLQCNWDSGLKGCDPLFDPVGQVPGDFPSTPPAFDDVDGNKDASDPYAALQFTQFAARFQARLAQWGWDPYAWDELDCSWQETADPADCRVFVYTNVLAQDEQGVYPYAGAFYRAKGEIFMGQGEYADTAYDGDIVVHEIGHHVTHSLGKPEPSESTDDGARLYTDIQAINEASSDFVARLLGTNDHIYDYFTALEPGTYVGARIRDVSIPFRCPENVVGEVHMDGRIWVSALVDGLRALEEAGLADADAYASTYLGALAAIRHLPREQPEQLPQAREIVLDEIGESFGDEARDLVEELFDERGVGVCDYRIDLRQEPSLTGEVDPEDVLAARFIVLESHNPAAEPEAIEQNPFAPPVQHVVTLAEDEGGVALRFWPNLWRPDRPVDDVELTVAALVKAGDQGVSFVRDPDSGLTSNDAQLRFLSEPDGDDLRVVIDGLTPGQTWSIALVSLTPLQGDVFTLEDMRWELLAAPPAEDEEGGTGDETGDPAADAGGAGCGCTGADTGGRGWAAGWVAALAARRRRRGARA